MPHSFAEAKAAAELIVVSYPPLRPQGQSLPALLEDAVTAGKVDCMTYLAVALGRRQGSRLAP